MAFDSRRSGWCSRHPWSNASQRWSCPRRQIDNSDSDSWQDRAPRRARHACSYVFSSLTACGPLSGCLSEDRLAAPGQTHSSDSVSCDLQASPSISSVPKESNDLRSRLEIQEEKARSLRTLQAGRYALGIWGEWLMKGHQG